MKEFGKREEYCKLLNDAIKNNVKISQKGARYHSREAAIEQIATNQVVNEDLNKTNIMFIRIDGDRIYIGYTIDVPRGIKRNGKPKEKELLVFGCRKDNIPDKYKAIVQPYLQYEDLVINFRKVEEYER